MVPGSWENYWEAERITEELTIQQVDIDGMQFGFMLVRETTNAISVFCEKEELRISRFRESFWSSS